jgi:transketolase
VVYSPVERFPLGGSKVLRSSPDDVATVVAAGITVHEALAAAATLADEGIRIRVIDAYSIKPIDRDGLRTAAAATGNRVITVEDHWPEGGLGDAVLAAFADTLSPPRVIKLAVPDMPLSGTPSDLLNAAHIDAPAIAATVHSLIGRP